MKKIFLLLGLGVCSQTFAGLTVFTDVAVSDAKPSVTASIFALDGNDFRVKAVSVAALSQADQSQRSRIAVKDLSTIKLAAPRPGSATLYVNGGFSGSQADRPVGLLISGNRLLSIPNFSRIEGDPQNSCTHLRESRYKYSGLACVQPDGTFYTGQFVDKMAESCSEAVQTSPVLVREPGGVAVCSQETTAPKARRTALCTTSTNGTQGVLNIVVTNHPVSLFEFATWLASPQSSGGLGCSNAINLSGDNSSGAILLTTSGQTREKFQLFGDGSYPQASFLSFSGPSSAVRYKIGQSANNPAGTIQSRGDKRESPSNSTR